MKKKEAIKLIKSYLPSCIHAVLLKENNGKYSIATTYACVEHQITRNFKKVRRYYYFLGLPGKINVLKVKDIKF